MLQLLVEFFSLTENQANNNMSSKYTVTVLGGGSFGTAVANIIATNGHVSRLWMRDAARAGDVRRLEKTLNTCTGYPCTITLWQLPI